MKLPYNGEVYVSSPFGPRLLGGKPDNHPGIDLVGKTSKTILSPVDGVVVSSNFIPKESGNKTWEWGNYVSIWGEGYLIYMCHMERRLVVAGENVKAGDPIGIEGHTGYCMPADERGRHCHFEVRKNGVAINPCPLLGIPNIAGMTHTNTFESEDDDMKKEEVIEIIKEYEAQKLKETKSESVPEWAEEELEQAKAYRITDGTRPCELTPRYQTAIMCKRVRNDVLDALYQVRDEIVHMINGKKE